MGFAIPEKMLAWRLYGEGMENFGDNDRPCEVPVPEIRDDELLVRIDAIGLCFSDVKLIRAGEAHPRVISKNLRKDPIIPGHEAVMTVVKVGSKLTGKFHVGQRYIIQADIYVNGKGFAYGYAIDGGMAQYSVLDQRVLNGDEGCYLLPISDSMPSAVAALLEPWTCVQASYMIENRRAPLSGGRVLVAAGDDAVYRAGELLRAAKPASVTGFGISAACRDSLERELGVTVAVTDTLDCGEKFDDIFLCNLTGAKAEAAARLADRGAVISFIGNYTGTSGSFDVGRIHYEGFFLQGAPGMELSAAYGRNVRSAVKAGGCCWLPGGAGAMGRCTLSLRWRIRTGRNAFSSPIWIPRGSPMSSGSSATRSGGVVSNSRRSIRRSSLRKSSTGCSGSLLRRGSTTSSCLCRSCRCSATPPDISARTA